MGFNFSFSYGNNNQPITAERLLDGSWFYTMFSGKNNHKKITTDKQKLEISLCNPALLKAIKLNCDLFSLGKVYYGEGKNLKALSELQAKPNKHQTWKQFHWDYLFYRQVFGTSYLWRSNNTNLTSSETQFYFLNPARMEFDSKLLKKLDKLTLSNSTFNDLGKETIKYCFEDGTYINIPLSQIQPFFDLSNSVSGNWFKSNSVLDALYKVVTNNEELLNAQNINLRYSGKFGVTGQADPNDTSMAGIPMSENEKQDIESKVNGSKSVHAFKSKVNIDRFVSDIDKLKLDDQYLNQYFIICSMFGIPRDVAEANIKGSSTYENQEKSTGKHVSYALQPAGDDLYEWISTFVNQKLTISWNYLPFMQVFELDKATTNKTKAETYKTLIDAGMSSQEALIISKLKENE